MAYFVSFSQALLLSIVSFPIFSAGEELTRKLNNGLAITPPMGFVSIVCYLHAVLTLIDGIPTTIIPAPQTNPSSTPTHKH